MTIKEFEEKYNINFNGCFAYNAIIRVGRKMNSLPEKLKQEFIKDLQTLRIS